MRKNNLTGLGSFLIVVIGSLMAMPLSAQEYLEPLPGNAALQHSKEAFAKVSFKTAVPLPFVDDFSYNSVFPDPALWAENQVFINSTFPIMPPSVGVATFDGLGPDGQPWRPGNPTAYGSSDTLTSQQIAMAGLGAGDSVYLSFFIQPQGLGNAPESRDSLVLEFRVNDSTWQRIWGRNPVGLKVDSFYQVFVRVADPVFFTDEFQFRFRNYASLTGNVDHWHLDYVVLDKNRTVNDSLLNDVAFYRNGRSLLKRYYAMPLEQIRGFEGDELADSIYAASTNHFNVVKNTTFRFNAVEECTGSLLKTDFFQTINFPAFTDTVLLKENYKTELATLFAATSCDSLVVTTRYFLNNSPPDPSTSFNDTVVHRQIFHNYFAYDDGTAEVAYRIEGNFAKVALRYVLNKPDTLRGIQVHWAHVDKDISSDLINLIIWKRLDHPSGQADEEIYRRDLELPHYVDELNGFFTYVLDTPLAVSDTIFIGFQQVGSDNFRFGFDRNHNASQHLFFHTSGTWKTSSLPGAVMMRPVVGDPIPFQVGIPDRFPQTLEVYPNPTTGILYLRWPEGLADATVRVFDMQGRTQLNATGRTDRIDLSGLSDGIYLIHLTAADGSIIYSNKVVKTR
jgi:hypothetical protein